ncbi:hypothetical protein PAXRUDRAFT_825817 [Paxillus rubicundulus Ve08.2h10]|uniref:NADAR domain-containing protein n=1 Tax=Paxillus rubicundulus Ve08.2h10 TaxID=930991 RepID=A0A0D0DFQ3_9AGAM|nr:hypothetical protein PAXRUDRAFT_825817 [Paxillus rubicundulus Ve08.2h10]
MLDTRRIMKLFGLGGSPTTPQSASSGRNQRVVTQYSTSPSNVSLTPLSSGAMGTNDDDANYPPLTAPVAPVGASIAPFKASKTPPVLFYEKNAPFYEFTNFSPHDIMYKGKRYPTSEHLFQSFKFLDDHPEIAERIRKCGERPMVAFDEAHRYQNWVRTDWRQVNVEKMETALRLKFTQHLDLKAMLLGTGDAELIEDSPRDYFWGVGADNTGRNELGKALVRLREELRQEQDDPSHIPTARRDTNRFSVQDLTSLIPTRPTSLNVHRFSVAFTSAPSGAWSGTSTAHVGSPTATGLCEFCKMRPKYQNHQYCGRTCATEAGRMCGFCRSKPRYGKHPYCSRTCAAKASGTV